MKIFRTIFLSVSVLVGCNKITALRTPATSILSSNEARVKSSSLSKSTTTALEIGRGGDLPPLNQKSVATVGLAYLGLHGIVDIICPSKVVEFYGLDEQPALNPFYFSQIGALALNGVTFLLFQLYAKTSLINAVGYSCLPLSLLTVYQLAAGKYEKAGVNRNSGIFTLFFNAITAVVTLYQGETLLEPSLWIKGIMLLSGLHGINLVLTAQTMPLAPSTIAILRMLGTVSTYVAAAVLSQMVLFEGLTTGGTKSVTKAFGVLMGSLGVTSLPVWQDLRKQGSKGTTPSNVYAFYILSCLGMSYYMLM